jgi:predicted ester cyclase
MTRDEIVAMFDQRQQAFRRRDAIAVASFHAPDGTLESPMAGRVTGRLAIAQVYEAWFSGFPDLEVSKWELLVDGDRVIQLLTLEGTDNGGFMGLPPTGKAFHLTVVVNCTVKDDLIVSCRTIYDFTGLLMQIGVLKAKAV